MSVQEQYRTNFWTNPQRMNEHNVAVAVATHNFLSFQHCLSVCGARKIFISLVYTAGAILQSRNMASLGRGFFSGVWVGSGREGGSICNNTLHPSDPSVTPLSPYQLKVTQSRQVIDTMAAY